MDTMKVMRFDDSVAPPGLIMGIGQVPRPGRGEMLIRVKAAGVTPTELRWYPTTHTKDGAERTGAIPGHEFSGIVEAMGSKVDPGQIGGEVFGLNDWYAEGAIAQYCLATPLQLVWAHRSSVAWAPPGLQWKRSTATCRRNWHPTASARFACVQPVFLRPTRSMSFLVCMPKRWVSLKSSSWGSSKA
jgi:Alcohol dehydrogenase GroES-like domain